MIYIDKKTTTTSQFSPISSKIIALTFCLIFGSTSAISQQLTATAFSTSIQQTELAFDWSVVADKSPAAVIRTLKEEFGPYDSRLPVSLRVLGRQYQEASDHDSALVLLQDAWQLSRINDGFYSESQIPTLELIIYSEMELENWDAVDNHYAYLELLHRRAFDESDPRLELGLQKVSAWHVNALSFTVGKERVHHLRSAYHLFKDRLAMAKKNLDSNDPKFGYLHESIKITEYQLRLNSQQNKAMILQQQGVGRRSLLADSF